MCLRTKTEEYDDCTADAHTLARTFKQAHEAAAEMCSPEAFEDSNVVRSEYTEKIYSLPRVTVWLDDYPECVTEQSSLPNGTVFVVRPYQS